MRNKFNEWWSTERAKNPGKVILVSTPQIEIAAFSPKLDRHTQILRLIRNAFEISDQEIGCEIKIREALSRIWLQLFDLLSEQI